MDSRLQLPANTILDAGYRIVRVVGTGGFGITYEAEDINLATQVAIKEYYPFDFGDRDATMSVKPKSERHRRTFDWGRSNFLQEARTLARFEHPSIVRVTRVFEANSTAYMVMRFEQGQSFEAWLNGLGRLPTQDELDAIVAPLLSALELMHAADFLHRDIAPDNIIVRADGSPVLLDFGAARRAVAAMSRSLTGIVKAGYSPHEQYSADSRLQGPWSDLYALSATLYRAVMGRPPDEVALRIDEDHMEPASHAAKKGRYRPGFLHAIDACLKVRYLDRPQSVAQLRPMLMANTPMAKREAEPSSKPRQPVSAPPPSRKVAEPARPRSGRWLAVAAAIVALVGGAYGGLEYMRWQPERPGTAASGVKGVAAEAKAAADATQRQAELDATRRRQDEAAAAAAASRQAELDMERRQKEAAEAAQRQVDIEAEQRRKDEAERMAAEDMVRRKAEDDEKRQAEERVRTASAVLSTEDRSAFVRRVQNVLKESQCYDGAINGRSGETQNELDRFVTSAQKKGSPKPVRIELAKATRSDFEAWLRDADDIKGHLCAPKPKQEKRVPVANTSSRPPAADRPRRAESNESKGPPSGGGVRCWNGRIASSGIGCRNGTQ